MGGRDYAYLDLAALPAVGSAVLAPRPTVLFAGDGSRILFANAAGTAFFGEKEIEGLLERRFSPMLPATQQISRAARALAPGARRLERIRFAVGAGLSSIAAECTRIALPDGEPAVLVQLPQPGATTDSATAARLLVGQLAGDDCLVAILDAEGAVIAESGGSDLLSAGETAVGELVAALARSGSRLIKRAIRIGEERRVAGLAAVAGEQGRFHLLVVGPAERIVLEADAAAEPPAPPPAAAAPIEPAPPAAIVPPAAPSVVAAAAPESAQAAPPPADTILAGPMEAEPAPEPEPVAEAEPQAEAEPESEPAAADAVPFRFAAPAGPVRFVFQMDAAGRFTFVSPNFAELVGPRSAIAVGESWSEMAARLGLDPTGAVTSLIARRDTWSGVTLEWPLDGADQAVAVDLAALPAFSRERIFEGYRGFGVIRPQERRETAAPPRVVPPIGPAAASGVANNVIRLARPGPAGDGERLSVPEQDAFRRIAAALGAPASERQAPAKPQAAAPADTPTAPAETPAAPEPAAKVAAEPAAPAPAEPEPAPVATAEPVADREPASAASDVADKTGESAPVAEAEPPAAAPAPDHDEPEAPAETAAAADAPVTAAVADTAEIAVEAPVPPPGPAATPEPEAAPMPAAAVVAEPPLVPVPAERLIEAELAVARQSVIELEAILDTATDGVIVVDEDARIERLNRSAEALFGVESAAVAGLRLPDLLAEESRQSALDYLDGLARNGVASVLNDGREVIGRVPQGGLIPLFMTMGRLPQTGKFCAVLRDITQWKNAEGELINARRAAESASMQKSDFLAKVSHEIRTPLNAIIGFSEVMMEERFGPIGTERYKEYLRDIHLSGAHLMSLLNDLLDLSKIEAGKLDLNFEAVALNEIVMECVALMQPQANRERIIIRTSLSGQVPSVVADPRSIRQIVLNLVSNAVKFTLAGGQVIVSTAMEPQGEVTLRIRDTGIGMSSSDIETALKPFRQLSASRERRSDGTGLGLPLTKALVEANRAAFAIDSTVGQGTLIRITFPATRVLAG